MSVGEVEKGPLSLSSTLAGLSRCRQIIAAVSFETPSEEKVKGKDKEKKKNESARKKKTSKTREEGESGTSQELDAEPSSSKKSNAPILPDDATLRAFISSVPEMLASAQSAHRDRSKIQKLQQAIKEYCERYLSIIEEHSTFLSETTMVDFLRVPSSNPELFREFPQLRKRLVKGISLLWATWPEDSVRIVALLALHAMVSRYGTLREVALRSMYTAYGRACRTLTAHTLGQASLLLNGLVEIFALAPSEGAELGLRALRQMAALLQQAIKHPLKENMRKLLCWRYVSLLRFWGHLLATQSITSKGKERRVVMTEERSSPYIKKLLTPFTGILASLANLQFSPRHFPFVFHLVAAALELLETAGSIVPVTHCLLRIIRHISRQPLYRLEMHKAAYDLVAILKVSQSEINNKGYLEAVAEEAFYYILKFLAAAPRHLFSELALPICSDLKMIVKEPKADRTLRKQIEGHLAKINQQRREVVDWRRTQDLTPSSLAGKANVLLPEKCHIIDAYLTNLEKVRLMKKKLLADKQDDEELDPRLAKRTHEHQKSRDTATVEKKRAKIAPVKLENKRKSRKTAVSKHSSAKQVVSRNEEDIIEDFIVD